MKVSSRSVKCASGGGILVGETADIVRPPEKRRGTAAARKVYESVLRDARQAPDDGCGASDFSEAPGLAHAQPHRRERELNDVRDAQMAPTIFRILVVREHPRPISIRAFTRLWEAEAMVAFGSAALGSPRPRTCPQPPSTASP